MNAALRSPIPSQPPKMPAMAIAVERYREAFGGLEKSLNELEQRLQPVSSQSPKAEGNPEAAKPLERTVYESIENLNSQLAQQTSRIRLMLDLLEV